MCGSTQQYGIWDGSLGDLDDTISGLRDYYLGVDGSCIVYGACDGTDTSRIYPGGEVIGLWCKLAREKHKSVCCH